MDTLPFIINVSKLFPHIFRKLLIISYKYGRYSLDYLVFNLSTIEDNI